MTEDEFISVLREHVPCPPAPAGPGDDCAVLTSDEGRRRVVTSDALVEGTHFLRAHPPDWLGHKVLAVNLSDVASMGAKVEAFTLSVALPKDTPSAWWLAFANGLGRYAEQTGVELVGGDMVRSKGPIFFSVTAWGQLETDGCLDRTGGRAGDVLMQVGPLGRSGAGLERWLRTAHSAGWPAPAPQAWHDDPLLSAHLRPEPPLWAGPWALAHGASAAMDCSDGLVADLTRLAEASGVELEVNLDALPADPALRGSPVQRAKDGEDYGLICLVPESQSDPFVERGFTALGRAEDGAGVRWLDGERVVEPGTPAFDHFGSS